VRREEPIETTQPNLNGAENGIQRQRSFKRAFSKSWQAVKDSTKSKTPISASQSTPPAAVHNHSSDSHRRKSQGYSKHKPSVSKSLLWSRPKVSNSSKTRHGKSKPRSAPHRRKTQSLSSSSSTESSSKSRTSSLTGNADQFSGYPYPRDLVIPPTPIPVPKPARDSLRQARPAAIARSGYLIPNLAASSIGSLDQIIHGDGDIASSFELPVCFMSGVPPYEIFEDGQRSKRRKSRKKRRTKRDILPQIPEEEEILGE
jgi:hypothetical protein